MINQIQVLKSQLLGEAMLDRSDKYSKMELAHIPMMITENDNILCLPNNKETSHIGFTAMTGKGKGIGGNTLLGFEYWMKNRLCLVLNDFQQETFENSLPCLNKKFIDNLNFIGTRPLGYPMVYVFPSNKDLVISDEEKIFPHIMMSMPTPVVIRRIEDYFKLDKAAKYVTGYIERFIECRDLDEIDVVIRQILNENFPEIKKKSYEEMKFKIKTIFKNVFDEQITDNATPNAYSYLTISRKGLPRYNNLTIQSLIACGLIPSIQTSEIRSKPWFSPYMSFIVESIYEDMYKDPFFKDKSLSMFVPEIDKMWKGKNGKLIKDSLSLIGTNGRRAGMGMRWDAQDYDAVPDAIRSNTKYLFVLRKANSKEVAGIKKDFNVDKKIQEDILSLQTDPSRGIFECVALTTDRFVLYNTRTGSISYTNEAQKGKLITPLSHHKYPGMSLKELVRRI